MMSPTAISIGSPFIPTKWTISPISIEYRFAVNSDTIIKSEIIFSANSSSYINLTKSFSIVLTETL